MSDYNTAPSSSGGGKPGSGGSGSGGKGSKGGGKKGPGAYSASNPNGVSGAESRAIKRENKAKSDAARKYREQAKTLSNKIGALKVVLSSGYKKALDQRLRNATLVYGQQDKVLMDSYNSRVGDLKGSAKDNEKAAGDQSFSNLTNRGRERASAISEAMMHGSGESDVLRSQMMSLQNWSSNAQEGTRAFFDGLRSINSSLGDLNADTKTGRVNLATQFNADRDALWTDYYNRKSQTYTELGNTYGEQSNLYSSAAEMGSKGSKKDKKSTDKASKNAFNQSAAFASKAWENPGVSDSLMKWNGTADFKGEQNISKFQNAQTIGQTKKPEGAQLRSW